MAPRASKKSSAKKKSAPPAKPPKRALHYKVVELNAVDEGSLERTINEWVPHGWKFDGVQFAMRESSKRPSMAFVFFTREGDPIAEPVSVFNPDAFRSGDEADAHLRRLSASTTVTTQEDDAWARLQALAGDDDE
ncbi:MAG: hypothetical protein JNM17_01865 [Archangium sp.]|nr:hypothetical protein [Archangium sp.]